MSALSILALPLADVTLSLPGLRAISSKPDFFNFPEFSKLQRRMMSGTLARRVERELCNSRAAARSCFPV